MEPGNTTSEVSDHLYSTDAGGQLAVHARPQPDLKTKNKCRAQRLWTLPKRHIEHSRRFHGHVLVTSLYPLVRNKEEVQCAMFKRLPPSQDHDITTSPLKRQAGGSILHEVMQSVQLHKLKLYTLITPKILFLVYTMSLHLLARTVLPRFCYGHAIRWDTVAQLPASMLCIEAVN